MGKIYRSALGKPIDMDLLRLANEHAVAIGNMRTNARGDELGPGGKIIKTRNQIIREYNTMTGKIAEDATPSSPTKLAAVEAPQIVADEIKSTAKVPTNTSNSVVKEPDPFMVAVEDIDGGV